MVDGSRVRAWHPAVPGIDEVFHARFVDHAYPLHTHSTWTLLVVDDGAVRYDLDRSEHGAVGSAVTLLPPGIAHDGRSATPGGFRKRVLYLDDDALPARLVGRAVDRPAVVDDVLRRAVDRLHRVLDAPGDELSARSGLVLITDRLAAHLEGQGPDDDGGPVRDPRAAGGLRDLLDAHLVDGLTLDDAAATLHVDPTHLVKCFAAEFGLPPHRYLVGRRVEAARRLLLAGVPAARVAVEAGFHDQAHLTRHFRRLLGVTPGRYVRSALASTTCRPGIT
ncbi:AraC family transcriptional regulator [Actinomycetospora endophytica]|uniref:AraC family transcriptional regulator n=1 Tax=Actinomycetospora endophytica TaxID=2291215 RepID=A0ABS8P276_9PSEU|nr:AraC family transcriptional regulator [Actinomycetospora endophytica]MCD2192357.1 AraC family transcriptional regulator [Actinomycetospora endophytica]